DVISDEPVCSPVVAGVLSVGVAGGTSVLLLLVAVSPVVAGGVVSLLVAAVSVGDVISDEPVCSPVVAG
ncbi:hypothetical protein, partial [Glaesserella parasuis]|uniref:hypothetical protein n=1 Tax=Glaesserella parasuis TaxID=738 RepID=UPI0013664809